MVGAGERTTTKTRMSCATSHPARCNDVMAASGSRSGTSDRTYDVTGRAVDLDAAADRRTDPHDTVAPCSPTAAASPTCSVWNRNPRRVVAKGTKACVRRRSARRLRWRPIAFGSSPSRRVRIRRRHPATAARAASDRMLAPSCAATPRAPNRAVTSGARRGSRRFDAPVRTGRLLRPGRRSIMGGPRRPPPDAVRATPNACLPPSATVEFADRDAF